MLDYVLLFLAICLAICAAAAIRLAAAARSCKDSRPCRHCGYDLNTLDNIGACPECGNVFCLLDGRPYFGPSRAWMRSFGILLLAATGTFVLANADLPTYRVFWVDMQWVIQEVAGDSRADHMSIVGQSNQHKEWSFIQTGERGGSGGGLPPDMPAGVSLNLTQVEFIWREVSLVIVKDPSSGNWVDVDGASIDASGVRSRLQAPSDFDRYLEPLLTMDWYNGDLRNFYESEAFHPPGDYGPGTENPFHRKRQPFHYMGYGWAWDVYRIGLYVTWGLIWIVAVGFIFLSFWVDRPKPSRKRPDATLPA